jgi:hypothetical protein
MPSLDRPSAGVYLEQAPFGIKKRGLMVSPRFFLSVLRREPAGSSNRHWDAAQPRTNPIHWATSGTEWSQLFSYSMEIFPSKP